MHRRGTGRAVYAALAAALLAACSAPAAANRPATAPSSAAAGTSVDIPVPAAVADIPLVDQSGRVVTLASLRGTTVVLADFASLCQEVCPLTSANLRAVDGAVRRAGLTDQVRILEVTVDPARDTPARLAAYRHLLAAGPGWSFLTGTPAHLAALWKWVGVAYARTPEPPGPAPRDWLTGRPLTYDIEHQDVVVVLDADGHERWLVEGTPRVGASRQVPPRLQAFLNRTGRHNETAPAGAVWTAADVEAALADVTGHPVG